MNLSSEERKAKVCMYSATFSLAVQLCLPVAHREEVPCPSIIPDYNKHMSTYLTRCPPYMRSWGRSFAGLLSSFYNFLETTALNTYNIYTDSLPTTRFVVHTASNKLHAECTWMVVPQISHGQYRRLLLCQLIAATQEEHQVLLNINRGGRPPLAANTSDVAYIRRAYHLSEVARRQHRVERKTALICA